jgi:hypothetical protein
MFVVVRHIARQHRLQLLLAKDQHLVERLTTNRADPLFRERVCPGCLHRCTQDADALGAKDRIEAVGELGVPVADEEPELPDAVRQLHQQVPGLLGDPRSRRVPGHTQNVDPAAGDLDHEQHVQAPEQHRVDVEKSHARMPWACADNCRQVRPARRGAGSMPVRLSSSHTVLGATRYPSCASSPWTRRYPHVGFSAAIRRIRRRSAGDLDGRPGGRCGLVQWRLTRARCQRSNVSGVTRRWCRRCLETECLAEVPCVTASDRHGLVGACVGGEK